MHTIMIRIICLPVILTVCMFFQSQQSAGQSTRGSGQKISDNGKAFWEKDTIHVIRIHFSQCNYWDSLGYYKKIQDSLAISQYMEATVTIDGDVKRTCGLRFKGESSYDFYPGKKKPFRIKFDKFRKKQDYLGIEEMNLNNNFKDPTMIREKIYLDILNKYNLPAPRGAFVKLYVNDKYWGLYLATESIDKHFLESRFGDRSGNLFQGEPLANFVYFGNDQDKYYNKYVLKSNTQKNDWSDLVKFIKLLNDTLISEDEFLRRLDVAFDLEKCLRAWAVNNLIGNIDAFNMFYPHNFYFYHDSLTGKWSWISLDGNYSFAAWNPIMNLPRLHRMNVLIPDSVPYQGARPLLDRTLGKNPTVQKRYLEIVRDLIENDFNPDKMDQLIDSLSLRIRVSVYADTNKMYSNTDFDTGLSDPIGDPLDPGNFIPGLKSFNAERIRFVKEQIQELQNRLY